MALKTPPEPQACKQFKHLGHLIALPQRLDYPSTRKQRKVRWHAQIENHFPAPKPGKTPSTNNMDTVIIIGTDVFGLSAVDHILQRWPATKLSIISRPSPLAPSEDISKIVRVDYNNPERMREALGAQKDWSSNGFSKLQRGIGRIYSTSRMMSPHLRRLTRLVRSLVCRGENQAMAC